MLLSSSSISFLSSVGSSSQTAWPEKKGLDRDGEIFGLIEACPAIYGHATDGVEIEMRWMWGK